MNDKIKCPLCDKGELIIKTTEIDIPYYGLAYLLIITCERCSFKATDIVFAKVNEPMRFIAEINNIKDQEIKIAKSSTAILKIPELQVKMEPGSGSMGYITNIEGILLKFKDFTATLLGWLDDNEKKKKCTNTLRNIDKALKGKLKFNLIVEDPNGNSVLFGEPHHKIKKELLTQREIDKLKNTLIK